MNFGGEFYDDIHVNEFKPTCLKVKNRLCHSIGFCLFVSLVCARKYCNLFYKCIMEGAAVVTIAHGIDTRTNGGDSIVAYSADVVYQIGKTLYDADEEYMKTS